MLIHDTMAVRNSLPALKIYIYITCTIFSTGNFGIQLYIPRLAERECLFLILRYQKVFYSRSWIFAEIIWASLYRKPLPIF